MASSHLQLASLRPADRRRHQPAFLPFGHQPVLTAAKLNGILKFVHRRAVSGA